MKTFKSILQFQKEFDTDQKCRTYLELQRWGNTPACPHCGSINVCRFANGYIFKCREKQCRKKFSATVGTVYESSKIPLTKWFLAMYIITNHSKGISSYQLAKWLDVTQKTAWFINHRIRESLTEKQPELLYGVVEVDETYVGGKVGNKHKSKRKDAGKFDNKTMVFGAVKRNGKVTTKVVPNTTKESLINAVKESVEQGSTMVSDENMSYSSLSENYNHVSVNHGKEEYVRGAAHTNTIEGFWSLLKRQIVGIHHSVSGKHLQRYCHEASYRYNNRALAQDERFADALTKCEGRLKYQDLITSK
jgi:transposase-like protein